VLCQSGVSLYTGPQRLRAWGGAAAPFNQGCIFLPKGMNKGGLNPGSKRKSETAFPQMSETAFLLLSEASIGSAEIFAEGTAHTTTKWDVHHAGRTGQIQAGRRGLRDQRKGGLREQRKCGLRDQRKGGLRDQRNSPRPAEAGGGSETTVIVHACSPKIQPNTAHFGPKKWPPEANFGQFWAFFGQLQRVVGQLQGVFVRRRRAGCFWLLANYGAFFVRRRRFLGLFGE
jgi:hypothetical protein